MQNMKSFFPKACLLSCWLLYSVELRCLHLDLFCYWLELERYGKVSVLEDLGMYPSWICSV